MAQQHEEDHGQSIEPPAFSQLSLEGLETQESMEVTFENCLIVSRPVYTRSGKTAQWQCGIHAPPDIFNQERDEIIVAHATTNARLAYSLRLMPGDRVSITGKVSKQELEMVGGEKTMVNYLAVSDIQVISRIKRESLTVYEKKRGR